MYTYIEISERIHQTVEVEGVRERESQFFVLYS